MLLGSPVAVDSEMVGSDTVDGEMVFIWLCGMAASGDWSLDFGLEEKSWLSRLVLEDERRLSPVFSDADIADWVEKGFASRRGMISTMF